MRPHRENGEAISNHRSIADISGQIPATEHPCLEFLRAFVDPGEVVTFQTFADREALKHCKDLTRVFHTTLEKMTNDDTLANLQSLNASGAGVFWTVNTTDGAGRKTENVTRVRAVFADLDGVPLEPVRCCELEPTAIVESSKGKYHAYWKVLDVPLEQFKVLQQAIAKRFESDPKVCDLPRVMRLPGFKHQKLEPFVSKIIQIAPVRGRSLEQLRATFPMPKPETQPTRPVPTMRQTTIFKSRGVGLEAYVNAALGRETTNILNSIKGNRNDTLNKAAFALGQFVGAGALEESEAREALETCAISCGLPEFETRATIQSGLKAGMSKPRDFTQIGLYDTRDSWTATNDDWQPLVSGNIRRATKTKSSSKVKSDCWHSETHTVGGTSWL